MKATSTLARSFYLLTTLLVAPLQSACSDCGEVTIDEDTCGIPVVKVLSPTPSSQWAQQGRLDVSVEVTTDEPNQLSTINLTWTLRDVSGAEVGLPSALPTVVDTDQGAATALMPLDSLTLGLYSLEVGAVYQCGGVLSGEGRGGPVQFEIVNGDGDGDGYLATAFAGDDCDDQASSINPGATEVCDGLDQDCDTEVDEEPGDGAPAWFSDDDEDGWGDPDSAVYACHAPTDAVADGTDCDDQATSVNPGADEVCNGIDDDCDLAIDDDDAPVNPDTWYTDKDDDGYGDSTSSYLACDPDGGVADSSDCDDEDALAFPGADETCDGEDQDCDTAVDEEPQGALTWYPDVDGDGYGSSNAVGVQSCNTPDEYVGSSGDCNDDAAAVYPGALEFCDDEVDQDCDGATDDCPHLSGIVYLNNNVDIAIIQGTTPEDGTGYALLGGLDIDGDSNSGGAIEIAVGAPFRNKPSSSIATGAVMVIEGPFEPGAVIDVSNSAVLLTLYGLSNSGSSVQMQMGGWIAAEVGLVGGGTALVMGSERTSNMDRVAIIEPAGRSGSIKLDDIDDTVEIKEAKSSAYFGSAGAIGLDVLGTPTGDLAVGGPSSTNSNGEADAGDVYIFAAPLSGVVSADPTKSNVGFILEGDLKDEVGTAVAMLSLGAAGDYLVIGAPGDGGSMTGRVFLVELPMTAGEVVQSLSDQVGLVALVLSGEGAGDLAGSALTAPGDVNGDGFDDLVVGAPGRASGRGAAYVVSGAELAAVLASQSNSAVSLGQVSMRVDGSGTGDSMGAAVARAGDVDGDGAPDILLGAPDVESSSGTKGIGAAYLFYSSAFAESGLSGLSVSASQAPAQFLGGTEGLRAGFSLASAGDLNADGYDDILVGTDGGFAHPGEASTKTQVGRVYVLYGGIGPMAN